MAETKGRVVGWSCRPALGGRRDHAETTARHCSGCSACVRDSRRAHSKNLPGITFEIRGATAASRVDRQDHWVYASAEPKDEPVTPHAGFFEVHTAASATAQPPAEPETEQRSTLSSPSSEPRYDVLAPVDDAPEVAPTDRSPAPR